MFFEEIYSHEVDEMMGMGTFPEDGLSQMEEEGEWFYPDFKFTEDMMYTTFSVKNKAQLEMGLSQGCYNSKLCALEYHFTSLILKDAINEIIEPTLIKVPPQYQQGDGLYKNTHETGLTKQDAKDLEMSNKKTQRKYTGYVKDQYKYIENEENVTGSPKSEVTLCNFFSFLKHNRFNSASLCTVYSAINNHYKKLYGKKLDHMMMLKNLTRNTKKSYVARKANNFTKSNLRKLLDE